MTWVFAFFLLMGGVIYLITFRLKRKWRICLALGIGLVLPILLLISVIIVGDRPM